METSLYVIDMARQRVLYGIYIPTSPRDCIVHTACDCHAFCITYVPRHGAIVSERIGLVVSLMQETCRDAHF